MQLPKLLHGFILPEVLRLENRQMIRKGNFLDRRKRHLHAPVFGTIRLGIDTDHIETIRYDFFQAGGRDIRRAHEDNSHAFPPIILRCGSIPHR